MLLCTAFRLATPRMRRVRRCAGDRLRLTRAGRIWWKPPSPELASSAIWRPRERQGPGSSCISCPLVRPTKALDRIRNRVALGGHDAPEADARRRFVRSHAYLPVAITWTDVVLFDDDTDLDRPYREVAILTDGTWWIAEAVPDWASKALARTGLPDLR